jgi:hypothetical protein
MTNNPLQNLQEEAREQYIFRHPCPGSGYERCSGCQARLVQSDELVAHVFTAAIEEARKVLKNEVLWDWPREIVTTNNEAQKSYYRESLMKQADTRLKALLDK